MENVSSISSEEELLGLREEGKISEGQYQDLRAAMKKASPNNKGAPDMSLACPAKSEILALRKRVLISGIVICVIGLPLGIALGLPIVWGLAIVGLVVAPIKLHLLRKRQHDQG